MNPPTETPRELQPREFDGLDAEQLRALQERIGYSFNDHDLLLLALTHRSWASEHAGCPTNERLEFLGDAVLGCAIADICYRTLPDKGEGDLTALRKSVVNSTALANLARRIEIGPLVHLGRGESLAGGADKESILSDALEALLGAIYLDGGAEHAMAFVEGFFEPLIADSISNLARFDEKSNLQEIAARLGAKPPEYKIRSSGPDHMKVFTAEVDVAGVVASGTGRSKKAAQQEAAHRAVSELLDRHSDVHL